MRSSTTVRQEPLPAERIAEASVWISRLHDDNRTRALELGFRQWLQQHPQNPLAFELATEVWEDAQNLRRIVPFATEVEPRKRPRLLLAGAVTAFAALMVAGLMMYQSFSGVATRIGEQRLLTFEDGTRIFLNTATRVVVHYDKGARRVELKSGEALFEVAKRPDWPFIVTAGERQVRALGTSFVVKRDQQRLVVTLVEGKVAVSPVPSSHLGQPATAADAPDTAPTAHSAGGASPAGVTYLTAGQRLTLAADQPARVDAPSIDKAMAWRRGQVVLDDTPLSGAVLEMNRYSQTQLIVERPEAQGVLVNGLFQAGDSASFAKAVATIYGLKVIARDDRIILSGTPRQH